MPRHKTSIHEKRAWLHAHPDLRQAYLQQPDRDIAQTIFIALQVAGFYHPGTFKDKHHTAIDHLVRDDQTTLRRLLRD